MSAFALLHLGVKVVCLKDLGSYVDLFSQPRSGHLRLQGAVLGREQITEADESLWPEPSLERTGLV